MPTPLDAPPPLFPQIDQLVKALEAGAVVTGQALVVEDLSPVMRNVTYRWPSVPRTWAQTLWWVNIFWRDLFRRGPRSFWYHARNRELSWSEMCPPTAASVSYRLKTA